MREFWRYREGPGRVTVDTHAAYLHRSKKLEKTGNREKARVARQIAAGSLKEENGLVSHD